MQGLRTQETSKFLKFFKLIQLEADKKDAVFFSDCGQGDIYEDDKIECEDLCGWLIPKKLAAEFEPVFLEDSKEQHKYDDFYVFVDFKVNGKDIEIIIDDTDFFIDDFNILSREAKVKDAFRW